MNRGYELFNLRGSIKKYQPLILFVVKTFAILLFFFLLKTLHHYLIDPSFLFFIPSLKELNLYLVFSKTISYPSEILVSIMGHDVISEGRVLSINGFRGVEIQGPCMGLDVFASLIALIVSYPSKVKIFRKAFFLIIGLLIIHLLNILRVSALLIKNRYSYDLSINHHDLFNIVVYAFVLLLFYFWIKYNSKTSFRLKEQTL